MSALPEGIGGCTLCRECGTGAYGTVYWGQDAIGRSVALKLFHGTRDYAAELASLRRYSELQERSPYLMRIYHFGCENGRLYYIMEAADNASENSAEEYVPDTLALRLKTGNRMAAADALALCQKLMDGLEVLHKAGMAHRDLKPDNIIFVGGEPRISDPDLLCESSRTMSLVGTLGYIPPEILLHPNLNKGPGADIYAMGKMLYCMTTGAPPEAFPTWPRELSQESLAHICLPLLRLCSENPSLRPESIAECRKLFMPEDEAATAARRRRRLAIRWIAVLAALLVALLAVCLGLRSRGRRLDATMASEREWWQQLRPGLAAQLSRPMDGIEDARRNAILVQLGTLLDDPCGYGEWRRRSLALRQALRDAALDGVPATDAVGYTAESVLSNGRGYGYLESPLATAFLPEASRTELNRQLSAESARIYPEYSELQAGRDFHVPHIDVPFHLTFIAPGEMLAPKVSAAPLSVDYPFWILPEHVTAGLYNALVPPLPPENRLRSGNETMVQVCLNDIMQFCSRLTSHLASQGAIPPGYGIRPPTVQELALASRKIGADIFDSNGAIDPERYEFLGEEPPENILYSSHPHAFPKLYPDLELLKPGWKVTPCALPMEEYLWGAGDAIFIRDHRDFRNMLLVGFRVVLAPTDDGYYQRHFTARHDVNYAAAPSGKHYMGCSMSMACITFAQLEAYAESLGAHLAEPKTKEQWHDIRCALDIPPTFPVYINAQYDAEAQRWRYPGSGTGPDFLPIPAMEDEKLTRLYAGLDKVGMSNGSWGLPGIVIEWPDEATAQAAGERWRDGSAGVVRRKLAVEGHDYLLVAFTAPAYYADSFCNAAGYRLAMPDSATLARLQELLKDETEPILLGCHRTLENKWDWNDGRPFVPMKDMHVERLESSVLRASPTYDCLCLNRGEIAAVSHGSLMLAEPEN